MKYKSDLIKEIVEIRGHNLSSPHYESECVESWIEETIGAYPKLCDYESEWLNYINENHSGDFSYETITVITEATVDNVIPYAYKSAILKGNTDENLQSVKMPVLTTTGKNLFNIEHFANIENWDSPNGSEQPYFSYKLNLKPNTKYTFSRKDLLKGENTFLALTTQKGVWDSAGGFVHPTEAHNKTKLTVETNDTGVLYLNMYKANTVLGDMVNCLTEAQVEESSVATTYEPFKSNILTVNEDVELRGIGEVKDELDLLTGEVIERIGEVVLDGSSDEIYTINGNTTSDGLTRFVIDSISNRKQKGNIISNLLPITNDAGSYGLFNGIRLNLIHNCSTVDDLKIWLQQNPITVQYELETESIKTVALTSLNRPYKGTNHYHLTANIPCEAILEVPVVSTGKQTIEEINN